MQFRGTKRTKDNWMLSHPSHPYCPFIVVPTVPKFSLVQKHP